jgi:hypothetical protein
MFGTIFLLAHGHGVMESADKRADSLLEPFRLLRVRRSGVPRPLDRL